MSIADFVESIRTKRARIGVVGDSVLDVYKYGKVSRVSPEFPVPILLSGSHKFQHYPGGAANVCYQLSHFNADVSLFSFIDEEYVNVLGEIIKFNIDNCVDLGEAQVPRKIRFYDDEFPMLRHDVELPNYGKKDLNPQRWLILHRLENQLRIGLDAVILSNYNKGMFDKHFPQKLINLCKNHNVPVIVDTKNNPEVWKGCSVFKPNSAEAYQMTGESDWKAQCLAIHKIVECDAVIITQQGSGVVGWDGDFFEYRPKGISREVSSTIGAGDCFAAVLSLCVAQKIPIREAINYAFESGVQYVKTRHNRPITLYELHRRLDPINAKILSVDAVASLRHGVYKDQRWVISNGCIDLIHVGHLFTLQAAKSRGDKLVVALNSDISIASLKGSSRPILPLHERSQLVAGLECVDFVVSFDEDVPYNVVKALSPHVLAKGGDYKPHELSGHDLVEEVYITGLVPGSSTTNIINKIKNLP